MKIFKILLTSLVFISSVEGASPAITDNVSDNQYTAPRGRYCANLLKLCVMAAVFTPVTEAAVTFSMDDMSLEIGTPVRAMAHIVQPLQLDKEKKIALVQLSLEYYIGGQFSPIKNGKINVNAPFEIVSSGVSESSISDRILDAGFDPINGFNLAAYSSNQPREFRCYVEETKRTPVTAKVTYRENEIGRENDIGRISFDSYSQNYYAVMLSIEEIKQHFTRIEGSGKLVWNKLK